MTTPQGSLMLLDDPVAQQLLQSAIPARLGYTWKDGTPRVTPIWFHWTGAEFALFSPPNAPKMKVLTDGVPVALAIDHPWPLQALLVRGPISLTMVDSRSPEYATMVERYLGAAQVDGWLAQYSSVFPRSARIAVRPVWVGVIDVVTHLPSAWLQEEGE